MISFNADSIEMKDSNGVVRVKIGKLGAETVTVYMFHFTKDGEYVDGTPITNKQSQDTEYAKQLAQEYESCHAWVRVDGNWMSLVAVALPWERWSPESETNVPECVRLAEYVRDKA